MNLFAPKGGKGLKFPTPGTTYTGTINAEPYEEQQKEYGSDRPATYQNGDPKMQILVNLDTQLREEADDDGRRTLYVTSAKMKRAIFDAIAKSGASNIEIGGTLTVSYTGNDPASKNPANPAKLYAASYVPPAPGTASVFAPAQAPAPVQQVAQPAYAAPQPPAQPVQQAVPVDPWNPPQPPAPAPAPAPVAQPVQQAPVQAAPAPVQAVPQSAAERHGINEQMVQQLANTGLDDAAIAAALGKTAEQISDVRAELPL